MKRRIAVLTMLVVVSSALIVAEALLTKSDAISQHQAIELLEKYERSHQQVVDNPSLLDCANTTLIGDLAFHINCVKEYRQLKEYVREAD